MPTRRQFIKTGIAGSALLFAAYWMQRPIDRFGKRLLVERYPMEAALRQVVAAVIPVILAGALPVSGDARAKAVRRATDAVAKTVAGLGADAQREAAELFALLCLPPARVALAGVTKAWPDADEHEVRAFLDGWRSSSIALLRAAYAALHDLILGAWYADEAAWPAIGYPGPPNVPKP